MCDLETSRIGATYIYDFRSLRVNDLTLILLTWRKWWANNASKQQMGFNSAFKGLIMFDSSSFGPLLKVCFITLIVTETFDIWPQQTTISDGSTEPQVLSWCGTAATSTTTSKSVLSLSFSFLLQVFQETLNKQKWQQGGSRLQCCCSFYSSINECYFSLWGWSDIVNTAGYVSDVRVSQRNTDISLFIVLCRIRPVWSVMVWCSVAWCLYLDDPFR